MTHKYRVPDRYTCIPTYIHSHICVYKEYLHIHYKYIRTYMPYSTYIPITYTPQIPTYVIHPTNHLPTPIPCDHASHIHIRYLRLYTFPITYRLKPQTILLVLPIYPNLYKNHTPTQLLHMNPCVHITFHIGIYRYPNLPAKDPRTQ